MISGVVTTVLMFLIYETEGRTGHARKDLGRSHTEVIPMTTNTEH